MKQKSSGTRLPAIIAAAVCITAVTVLLCKRMSDLQEEAEYSAYLESISRFAREYVSGKYGFEAKIIEDETFDNRKEWEWSKKLPGYIQARFTMTDPAGKTFFAYVEGDISDRLGYSEYYGKELRCRDFYQEEDIKQAVTNEIIKAFPEAKGYIVDFDLLGALPYFGGDDLDGILPDINGNIEIVFSGADLSQGDIIDRLSRSGMNIILTSFDTSESMDSFLENRIVTVTDNSGREYRVETLGADYYAPFEAHIISRFEKDGNEITQNWDSKGITD